MKRTIYATNVCVRLFFWQLIIHIECIMSHSYTCLFPVYTFSNVALGCWCECECEWVCACVFSRVSFFHVGRMHSVCIPTLVRCVKRKGWWDWILSRLVSASVVVDYTLHCPFDVDVDAAVVVAIFIGSDLKNSTFFIVANFRLHVLFNIRNGEARHIRLRRRWQKSSPFRLISIHSCEWLEHFSITILVFEVSGSWSNQINLTQTSSQFGIEKPFKSASYRNDGPPKITNRNWNHCSKFCRKKEGINEQTNEQIGFAVKSVGALLCF